MQTAPPVEDDVMQRIGELRSSMARTREPFPQEAPEPQSNTEPAEVPE